MSSQVKNSLLFGLAALLFGIAFAPTIQGIFLRWLKFDEAYSHGLLVLGISLYLFWRNARFIWPLSLAPNVLGYVLIILASTLWAVANALHIQVIEELLLPVLLWLILLSLYGWRQSKVFIVPAGFLYFAIPFWDYLAETLQLVTVAVNEVGFLLTGIEAEIEGVFVRLPGIGVFEVAHGCSGLRYLIVGLTLTALFGYLNYQRWSSRLILIALGVFLSLLANWVRVFIIIYAGYTTNMQSSLIEDHDMFGWLVFAATLVPLFWFAHRLANREAEPVIPRENVSDMQSPLFSGLVVLALLAVVLVPTEYVKRQTDRPLDSFADIRLPKDFPDWQSIRVYVPSDWSPSIRGYTQKAEVQYFGADKQVLSLNVYLYSQQGPGKELIQEKNRLYDSSSWKVLSATQKAGSPQYPYNSFVLTHKKSGRSYAVIQSYYVAGMLTADRVEAKLVQALGYIRGRHDASMITLSLPCTAQCDSQQAVLTNFLTSHYDSIVSSIDQAYLATVGEGGNADTAQAVDGAVVGQNGNASKLQVVNN